MSMTRSLSPSQKPLLRATVAPCDYFLSLLKSFSKSTAIGGIYSLSPDSPSAIIRRAATIQMELASFHNRALNRDLASLREQAN
jgi:hypothetical protein